MTSFAEALKAEIAHLEQQMSQDPTYMKLQQLRRTVELYRNSGETPPDAASAPSRIRAPSGGSMEILAVAKEFLAGRVDPTPTKMIMEVLADRGVHVGGTVPQNGVSSMLSKSEDFVSHGRSGWTLALPDSRETEPVGGEP